MLDLFGYAACVTVDGVQLPEFQADINETNRIATCWIPSEVGKKFAIQIKSSHSECETSARVSIDGSRVRKSNLGAANPLDGSSMRTIDFVRMVENGVEVQRPFCFSNIMSTDEERYSHRDVLPGLGEISVTTKRIKSNVPSVKKRSSEGNPTSHEILHEKFKKIALHCVSFGDPIPSKQAYYSKSPSYDRTDPRPFAKFVFKYSPADVLQANDIMPRPPRPQKRKRGGNEEVTQSKIRNLRVKLENMECAARKKTLRPKKETAGQSHPDKDDVIDLTREDIPVVKAEKLKSICPDDDVVIDLT